MLAVRAGQVAWPAGHAPAGGEASAAVVAGTAEIRSGDTVMVFKLVAVVKAPVRRDKKVQAAGSPCDHARLGVLEAQLDELCGPGVIEEAVAGVRLCGQGKKPRFRLLAPGFVMRALLLMTVMAGTPAAEAMGILAGDLAGVPWAKKWHAPSRKAFRAWCKAIGQERAEWLRDRLLQAVCGQHAAAGWHLEAPAGGLRPWAGDGTLLRVPDTAANRAAFGGDGPYPLIRAEVLSSAVTRAVMAVAAGPGGTGTDGAARAAAEQALLDGALRDCGWAFSMDQILLLDRNCPGAKRILELTRRTHVLIRVKSDIPLTRISEFFADKSYLARISGDGVTVTVRVIEYDVEVDGQDVPETFCLITDLLDPQAYPAEDLAELYKWRWDGSETMLREGKSCITGSGPGTGPMLRSGTPALAWQELAALITAAELVRALARDAAGRAVPARRGKRAGQPVAPRQISFTAARRAAIASIRSGAATASLPPAIRAAAARDITAAVSRCRIDTDRGRHRERKSKSAYGFPAAPRDITTRTAAAVITVCGTAAA